MILDWDTDGLFNFYMNGIWYIPYIYGSSFSSQGVQDQDSCFDGTVSDYDHRRLR